jgi:hypothetical protein
MFTFITSIPSELATGKSGENSDPSWLQRLRLENGTFHIAQESFASSKSNDFLQLFEAKKAFVTKCKSEENDPLIFEGQRYLSIMTQFQQTQLILQSTSLSSYKGIAAAAYKETVEKEKVQSNFLEALTSILDYESLSIRLLCNIHKILMEGLIIGGEIGVFRTKKNRVSIQTYL